VDADLLDHKDFVLDVDFALGLGGQPALARVDPARLQRAPEGAGESTRRGGDHVIEGRRVFRVLARRGAVVLAHRAVGAERDGLLLRREVGLADGAALPDDPYLRDISRLEWLIHSDELRAFL
jgi:hypothetical protein